MDWMGLRRTRAMNVPSKWFPALRGGASTERFYRDGKKQPTTLRIGDAASNTDAV